MRSIQYYTDRAIEQSFHGGQLLQMLLAIYRHIPKKIKASREEFAQTVQTVRQVLKLAKYQKLFISTYVFLALLNAATESFSVMLIVPLLESFSTESIFSGVPLLDKLGSYLKPLAPDLRLRWIAGLLLIIIFLKAAAQYFTEVMVYSLPLRLERDLRMRAFSALMESRISYADSISSGDIGNYTAAFPARAGLALRFLIQGTAAFLTIIVMLGLLIAITPSALFGLLGFAILASALFRSLTGPFAKRLDLELTEAQQNFTQAYFEAVNNKKSIRLFNATEMFLGRIRGYLESLRKTQLQTIAVQNVTYPFFSVLAGISVCGLVFVASFYEPGSAQVLLGVLLIFLVAATRLLGPFSVLHICRMHFGVHSGPVIQMVKFLEDAGAHRDVDGERELSNDQFEITFDQVTYQYPQSNAGVHDLDFTVRPGQFVAIVGPSGSGKSTILHLLSRLLRPDIGMIRLDGIPLDELAIRTWWDKMSIVSQDAPIFNASLRDNILFGSDQDPDEARLNEALRFAAADGFVSALPDGLDTMAGEYGAFLSGGERQRIALARAFYHKPPVILLDEVTSQIDAETEGRIASSIEYLHKAGHTIIAIAHRPKTIRGADQLLVLKEGRIVAKGTHDQLLRDNPFYRLMAGKDSQAIEG